MTFRAVMGAAAALAMTATPAIAAPVANPAAKLSVASGVRAGASMTKSSKVAGGGAILGILIAAGVVAIGVVAGVNGDDDSDSN